MSIRKALLVGINAYPNAPLQGCINDVQQMQGLLKQYYGFQEDGIKLLLDREATVAGIKAGLEWLAEGGADPDAVRIFHYSGHGSYMADQNGDEPDGRDECLVPYDYESAGFITDDVLKELYDRFPVGGNLTLVMDSCHSGTGNRAAADVRFLPVSDAEEERCEAAAAKFVQDQQAFVFNKVQQLRGRELTEAEMRGFIDKLIAFFRKKRFGDVRTSEANILLAGCRSDQTSADAHIGGGYHGAFTYCLAQEIEEAQGQLTYRQLAERTGQKLKGGFFEQEPQLEYAGQRDNAAIFRPFV